MLDNLTKHINTTKNVYDFSVLIPTWNNKDYLELCIQSILKNSQLSIQIIVLINEGKDGTLEWVQDKRDIDYIYSRNNIGICYGLNMLRPLVKSDYIVYVNDDMYMLPNWDTELLNDIKLIGHHRFMLSSTMIEPIDTGNPCVVVKNYGKDIAGFNEELLLSEYTACQAKDWSGSMWPPNVVHTDVWDLVGGMSIEYSPGMYSDPDFARKLFEAGVRIFKGKGSSLVYHFGSKSTNRVKKNKGKKKFLLKWGITPRTFTREYLKIGEDFSEISIMVNLSTKDRLINKIKRIISSW